MDARRWEQMQALFHAAADLEVDQRAAFLEAACSDDLQMRMDVLALLEEDGRKFTLLDRDLAETAHDVLDGSVPQLRNVGPYRILRVLGRGGMGVVYLAEREDLGSLAAIKVLRDASLSPARRERFRREERLLAQLAHPSIARLYDADVLSDGTPYFVMEYVKGVPLTDYCREHACTMRERLHLFRSVCEAVQYAHRQAVLHRDLKPSNILVTESPDGRAPTVKLLDFGIAKQIDSVEAPAHQTVAGLRLMTPAYAAPEVLRGDPVGTYTDVYSLGVILYELLAQMHPFHLSGLMPGQIESRILNHHPERPSAAVARRAGDSQERPLGVGRQEWADLDVLCLTAIHQDPQRRYTSVDALQRDVDHYLKGEPLEARPDTLGYRVGKFLRRRRAPVAAAALTAIVLVSLVVFYTVQLTAARDEAIAESARTQRIQRFMLHLFEGDGEAGPSDSLRVITLLDRGVKEVGLLENEPDIQSELYQTLGTLYQELGSFQRADTLLQTALERRRQLYGPDHPEVARGLVALGLLRVDQAALEEAERFIREGLETSRRSLLPDHPEVVSATTALASALIAQGSYDNAIETLQETVRRLASRGQATVELSESINHLANAHFYKGNYATSDSLNRLMMAIDRELYGPRHPAVADALINLAASRAQLGHYEEAEQLYRQALEIVLGYHGPDHHATASSMYGLAQVLHYQARYDEADALLGPVLEIRERVYGADHPRVAHTLNELGTVALKEGDLEAAETYFTRMTAIYRKAYSADHYLIGIGLSNLASVYREMGQLESAERAMIDAVNQLAAALPTDHMHTATARLKLGRVLVLQGRFAEAEEPLLQGYRTLAAQANPSLSWLQEARVDLAAVYDALDRADEAERFRREWEASAENTQGV